MRLHFLVTSYLNFYIIDKSTKEVMYGHSLTLSDKGRSIADKRSHLMTVDKLVAEMHVGDTFLDSEEQIQDRVIKQFKRDEGIMISDFDGFMRDGNPFLPRTDQIRIDV